MSRISTISQHQSIQNSILGAQKRLFERQAQVSTGQASQDYTGIARNSQRLLNIEARLERSTEFIAQNKLNESRMQIVDSSLNQMIDVAADLKVRLIQRLDASSGTAGALASEASSMLNSITGLMNTQINGRFLFAGTATNTQPVTDPVPDPTTFGVADDTYYSGDSVTITARISESQTVNVSVPGDRAGFQQVIGALKATIQGDNLDNEALMESALNLVNSAITEINSYRSEIGSAMNVIARASERHEDFSLYSKGVIADIETVDIPSVVSALAADQMVLEASFLTVGRMSSLTLANFLG